MLNEYLHPAHVFIACGYTDLRLGIDGLAALVQEKYQLDPFGEALFFFCGRRTDRIKGLFWDGDGFLILYKRLERGRFQWPRNTDEARAITEQQFRWLMEGLKVDQPKTNQPIDTHGMVVV